MTAAPLPSAEVAAKYGLTPERVAAARWAFDSGANDLTGLRATLGLDAAAVREVVGLPPVAYRGCEHCVVRAVSGRGGRLCKPCRRQPGLSRRYPPAACRVPIPGFGDGPRLGPPPIPTLTIPGSEERILIPSARVDCGYDIEHPDDVTFRRSAVDPGRTDRAG